jgi:hypothetical protein
MEPTAGLARDLQARHGMQKSASKSNRAVKVCSRGHHYRGNSCPICWPGGVKRGVVKATAVKSKSKR